MTQIALLASVAVSNPPKDDCWFCKEKKPRDPKNDVDADGNTDDGETQDTVAENDVDNDFYNCASKLGKHMGGDKPLWTIKHPEKTDENTTVSSAAHHCIPGNASFKPVYDAGLKDFMDKGGAYASENVGYSINHTNNGVWLPGNYYVRKGRGGFKKNWGDKTTKFKNEYAVAAIEKSKLQFHDAHRSYNTRVKKTLQKVLEKLGEPDDDTCPICDQEMEHKRPPYGLVARLDFISGQHRLMLTGITKGSKKKKFVQAGYYTSSRVKKFFGIT